MTHSLKGSSGDPRIDLIFRDIYDILNKMEELLGKPVVGTVSGIEGREGSVRVVSKGNNSYVIAIKSKDGWLVSDSTTFTFTNTLD